MIRALWQRLTCKSVPPDEQRVTDAVDRTTRIEQAVHERGLRIRVVHELDTLEHRLRPPEKGAE